MIFEICVSNIASVQAAAKAGANRMELCAALEVGGLTPSIGLIEASLEATEIPVYVLIRARTGSFIYDSSDLKTTLKDIRICQKLKVGGVVIGALNKNYRIDCEAVARMKEAAGDLDITFHRAFDFTPNAFQALDDLMDLDIGRVLSSGQADSAWAGRDTLRKMVVHAGTALSVMPGAGVNQDNIAAILRETKAREIHFSAKKTVVCAGHISGLDQSHWESDEDLIRETMKAGR